VTPPEVVVHADADRLAEAVAERLVARVVDAQGTRGEASVVLTGGRVGTKVLGMVARSDAGRDAVDWRHVDVWWGDERFLPAGDPERNETQAREALLDHVPVDPERVFPMPAADGVDGSDVDAAAARYSETLAGRAHREGSGPVPRFDVLLLGVGPDGHVASLFPEHPETYDDRPAVGVRGAPKPPPIRISLTFPSIRAATEVWLVVAGADKAPAVRMALEGAGEHQIPASGARGVKRTLWLLDRAAAAQLPRGLERIASP